jgi:hypothetical protein
MYQIGVKKMKTREFNLENWSGQSVVVSYNVRDREFEAFGETFTIGKATVLDCGLSCASLYGVGWKGPLTNIIFQIDPEAPASLESAVIAATRWAANHV